MVEGSWFKPARTERLPDPPTGGAGYVRAGFQVQSINRYVLTGLRVRVLRKDVLI